MANKARHAFGSSAEVQKALQNGLIDAYDILFLDGETSPKIGWIDRNGIFRLVENEADFSELQAIIATKANIADVEALELEVATKVTAEEVDAKIVDKVNISDVNSKIETAVINSVTSANAYTDKMIEAAMDEHLTKKYDIANVPVGTLINYREDEIRIMVPYNSVWDKQNVGEGGDANVYYCTFKTYCPEGAVGYKEHLGNQVDAEILTDLKTDEYGRKYQPTWLGLAKYDETTGSWTYYGNNSTVSHYIGWDYQIDWYNANNVMIGSDCIRINLSNEKCHFAIEPYYASKIKTETQSYVSTLVEEKVAEKVEEKVAEVSSAYEIVEF